MGITAQSKIDLCGEVIENFTAWNTQWKRSVVDRYWPEVIQGACEICLAGNMARTRDLDEIIQNWCVIKAEQDEKNRECGHLFNPLETIEIGETTHSRLLGDLLNPKGKHGQGPLFLHAFLERLEVPRPEDGKWLISIETGRVDICLWRLSPRSVIVIENKSNWANDQGNQLYRYWHQEIYKSYPELDYSQPEIKRSFQIVYLPPTAGKTPSLNSLQRPDEWDALGLPKDLDEVGVTWKVLTFREFIADWLEVCIRRIPKTNMRLTAYLQFYKELWS